MNVDLNREYYSSGTEWEPLVGYARTVRVGPFIYVSGTTATGPDGEILGEHNAYKQTKAALENLERALAQVGARLEHVVRTRMYVIDITKWMEIGRAHGEVFRSIMPATSMIEVKGLINPEMLIEIEADAVVMDGAGHPLTPQ